MIAFWVAVGVTSVAAALLILLRAAAASRAEAVDPTLPLYRRQLVEIDELWNRGLLSEAERRDAHAEAARRLLAAADVGAAPWSTSAGGRGVLAAAALGPLAALGLYFAVGQPGAPDQPFAPRLAAWRAADPSTLTPPQMAAVLRAFSDERPRDPETQRYLALAEAAAGDMNSAAAALRRAVALAPARPELWSMLGEALIAQADGQATPDALAAFREALKRDPASASARFHLARARIEAGEREAGLAEWRALRADLSVDDPRRAALTSAIAEAARSPAPAARPSGDAIAAMVESLAQRLRANPDDPPGWVRLVRSYAVLGNVAARDAALAEARGRYAARPDILAELARAAAAEPMR